MSADASISRRPYIIAAIILATFMVAIEATIVATAMPHIVGQLGGFAYYSWVFSAFLLAQTTTTVIYGKLSDIFGRKPMLIGGVALFLLASLLCGFAWSMPSLIVFRLLQGLGAGAIQPITVTIVGDLYSLEKRGKVQGVLSAVWASSAVIGPLAGGLIVERMHWAWIFWANIPFGLLAIAGLLMFLHERVERREHRIDYLGAALFSIAIVSLLVILTEASASISFLLPFGLLFVVGGGLFLWHEKRAPEPMISLELWSRPLIAACNSATVLAGMALIGLTTVLPLYVQGVLGRSPMLAGFTLTMLIIGWPLAVSISGRLYRTFGIRNTLRFGAVVFPIGAAFLLLLAPGSHVALAGIGSFIMGFGMGTLSITSIVLIQDSVDWSARGSATSSNLFARSLGNTLGATVLGAILNYGIAHYASRGLEAQVHAVLEGGNGLATAAANLQVQGVLDRSLHLSFWGILVMAVLACLTAWLIPVQRVFRRTA
ncbi:MAG TPA: MDR family MFS transporter [Geminicoccus sp.]|jgi:EmrB/QacA subfamily drug resistance transporter|uniref:MDR family MFS transporter n=1 Tax=Geminicoccus sp. TaxID=2024832 RepID=UPI002E36A5F1|nr:MDR family MFS transporter [Geminicoccus sp.]HEX2528881.1 MDR family MFS transporter [Geminicoccus sp.]